MHNRAIKKHKANGICEVRTKTLKRVINDRQRKGRNLNNKKRQPSFIHVKLLRKA